MIVTPQKYLFKFFRSILLLITAGILLLFSTGYTMASISDGHMAEQPEMNAPSRIGIPDQFGDIIFNINSASPKQLYIIGQAHRSGVDGSSTPLTVQVQTEIYRIGEWLRQQKDVQLLLPEGFFNKGGSIAVTGAQFAVEKSRAMDDRILKQRLNRTDRFVNADLLLRNSYDMAMGQVENEDLYNVISNLLTTFSRTRDFETLCRINDLQSKRSAMLLKNIPSVIEQAFSAGQITNQKAIFTIGMAHISEIIEILSSTSQTADISVFPENWRSVSSSVPGLLSGEYGITVIIPRSLSDNTNLMRQVGVFH